MKRRTLACSSDLPHKSGSWTNFGDSGELRQDGRQPASGSDLENPCESMEKTPDGFITPNDTEFMERVARRLNELEPGLDAYVWHSGGGIFLINASIPGKDTLLGFGTVDTVWGADLLDQEGEYLDESLSTNVPSDCANVEIVAIGIMDAVRSYQ